MLSKKHFQYLKFIILIIFYLNEFLVLENKRTNNSINEINSLEYYKNIIK